MSTYVMASLDTTIAAVANAIELFARHPDQWTLLREHRDMIPNAFNEVLRYDSPMQYFCRVTTTMIGDDHLAEGRLGRRAVAAHSPTSRDAAAVRINAATRRGHARQVSTNGCSTRGLARMQPEANASEYAPQKRSLWHDRAHGVRAYSGKLTSSRFALLRTTALHPRRSVTGASSDL